LNKFQLHVIIIYIKKLQNYCKYKLILNKMDIIELKKIIKDNNEKLPAIFNFLIEIPDDNYFEIKDKKKAQKFQTDKYTFRSLVNKKII